ncbi:MAG: hypothetical protein NDI61_09865 [Bdellovibrionaceae bacterium]|nr:hypothetical protein [Pseudobdellovibrionaceae bacterium]
MKQRTRTRTARPLTAGAENISDTSFDTLESLVDELSKPQPQEERIRAYMSQAGLAYTADPIEQLSCVLRALENKNT